MIGRFHVNDHRFICRGVAFSVRFHSFSVSVRNTQCEQPHSPQENVVCQNNVPTCYCGSFLNFAVDEHAYPSLYI